MKTRRTWYAPKGTNTGTTGAHDFGFVPGPIVIRCLFGDVAHLAVSSGSQITGAADWVVMPYTSPPTVPRLVARASDGSSYVINLSADQYKNGEDLFVIIDGTSVKYLLGGHRIASGATVVPISFAGNLTVFVDGRGPGSRVAAWNPSSISSTLEAEIAACVNDPESDPASLTNKRIDYKLDSEHLPLPTSTDVVNDGLGGWTLVLGAGRDTSCKVVQQGYSP
jgi:hypothetical protein